MSALSAKSLSCILGTIPQAQGGFVNFFQMVTECFTRGGTSRPGFSTQVSITAIYPLPASVEPLFPSARKAPKPHLCLGHKEALRTHCSWLPVIDSITFSGIIIYYLDIMKQLGL